MNFNENILSYLFRIVRVLQVVETHVEDQLGIGFIDNIEIEALNGSCG
ncbi:MAG: hypothetical protein K9G46_06645 [Flavobacteriales bacterium]|nr:hypothetical protein [Flavobacteriales bacterium]